jgi:hypothetical protein
MDICWMSTRVSLVADGEQIKSLPISKIEPQQQSSGKCSADLTNKVCSQACCTGLAFVHSMTCKRLEPTGYQSECGIHFSVNVACIGSLHCRSGQESTNTHEENGDGILTINTDVPFFISVWNRACWSTVVKWLQFHWTPRSGIYVSHLL